MAGERQLVEFGDLLLNGTRNGVYKSKAFHGSGVKIVNMGELFAHPRLRDVPMKRVKLTESELEKSSLQAGDLLFARRSLVAEGAGKCSIVMEINEPTTFESSIIRARPDGRRANSLFLYYMFNSPQGRYLLRTILRQVAVSGITGTDLVKLKVPTPPPKEQQAIACILGALDDKIELNRKMNATLEGIARAIFKSWFVDFDPVRAKAVVRREHPDWTDEQVSRAACPNLKSEIAALFPDAFEDSTLGPIPVGSHVGAVAELADVVGGSTPSTKELAFWEGGTHHWATPKDLSNLPVPVLLGTERQITDAGLDKINSGLLPVGTVLLSSRAPIGYLAINQVPVAINQGFIAMRPRPGVSAQFLLRWAESAHETIVSRANGSTFLEISKTNFRPIQLVVPSGRIHGEFDRMTSPLFQQVVNHERESLTLAALRDALLPRLISGELRVPDAERIVGRAV